MDSRRIENCWDDGRKAKGVWFNTDNDRFPQITIGFTLDGKFKRVSDPRWNTVGDLKREDAATSWAGAVFTSLKAFKLTNDNISKATEALVAAKKAIAAGAFVFSDHFPNSKAGRAELAAAPDQVLMGTIFDAYESDLPAKRAKTRQHLRCWVRPQWDNVRAGDVTVTAVIDWIADIRDGKIEPVQMAGTRRPAGLRIVQGTMKQILSALFGAISSRAGQKVFGPKNPLHDTIDLDQLWTMGQARVSDYEVCPFSREERARVSAAAKTQAQDDLFTVWCETGLRGGELAGLRWDKVFLDAPRPGERSHLIQVRAQRVNGELTTDLKNFQSKREVPLTPKAMAVLTRMKAETVQHLHGYVFTNAKGEPFAGSKALYRPISALLKRAGIERNPEQCRHTFGSTLLSFGNSLWDVSKMMGHKSTATTEKYYARWMRDETTAHGFPTLRTGDEQAA